MPRKRRRKTESLEVVNRDCAGIDIGKDVHYVAVDPERCGDRGSPVPTHANQRNRFPEQPGSSHARQAPKRIPPENVTNAPSIIVSTLTNACLKDAFGARHVRVRGHAIVFSHLIFGVLALTVDQLMRLAAPP